MGEDPNRIRQQLDDTRAELTDARPAEAIRVDVDQTRSEMGATLGALSHKANVKGRVAGSVSQKKDAVVGAIDSLVSRVSGIVPDGQQVVDGAAKVGVSRQSPVGLVVAGGAFGLLVGLVIPSTRVEDERIGEMADQVKETVKETGAEAVQRGRQVAQDAASAASESTSQQGQQLTDTLQENVVKQPAPRHSG